MNDLDPIEAGQTTDVVPASSTADPSAVPAPLAPASNTPDQMFDVKIGGQARKVTLAELQAGYSRQQDYTQKTMALAEERRRIETQWNAERAQTREFLSRPENIEQLLQYVRSQRGPQLDPNQPLTAQQVQQMMAQQQQQLAQGMSQQRQAMMDELELKQLEKSYSSDLNAHINGILTENPVLRSIHGIDTVLKSAAAAGQPGTIEEAKQLILQKASEQVAAIKQHFTQQQKDSAIQQSRLRGIEPPGGAAPMPSPKPVGKMGSAEFNSDVAEYLRKLSGG